MSVRTMARVWDQSGHAGTELLMLLAIADFADDEGNAYPAVQTLAAKCRMSSRNANFILSALRQTGELEVRANEGPKGTNRYKVVTGLKPTSPLKPASPLKPTSSTPEAGFLKPLKPTSDEPSLNHQEPPIGRVRTRTTPAEIPCPADVDQQTWGDWLALRKRKNAPVTKTVITGARREAEKAGMTLEAFLQVWCTRGSQGLMADWLKPNERQTQSRTSTVRHTGYAEADYTAGVPEHDHS